MPETQVLYIGDRSVLWPVQQTSGYVSVMKKSVYGLSVTVRHTL